MLGQLRFVHAGSGGINVVERALQMEIQQGSFLYNVDFLHAIVDSTPE
jgi:hypothetical protein